MQTIIPNPENKTGSKLIPVKQEVKQFYKKFIGKTVHL
jgi:hypothetical protein